LRPYARIAISGFRQNRDIISKPRRKSDAMFG
jgi:hypothetical protein